MTEAPFMYGCQSGRNFISKIWWVTINKFFLIGEELDDFKTLKIILKESAAEMAYNWNISRILDLELLAFKQQYNQYHNTWGKRLLLKIIIVGQIRLLSMRGTDDGVSYMAVIIADGQLVYYRNE